MTRPRRTDLAAVAVAVLLFAAPLLVPWIGVLPAALAAVGLVGLAVARLRRRSRPHDGDDRSGAESVWEHVPAHQYLGRYAESGGATREEQETAIRDIQEQADTLERTGFDGTRER